MHTGEGEGLAYLSFDTVPAPKGASVHIEAFSGALADHFGHVHLVTVSPTAEIAGPVFDRPGVEHTALPARGPTLIHRVLHFREQLRLWWRDCRFQAVHIRSIYEGFPLALHKGRHYERLIFEVNGLPSIELKYRYPDVAEDQELLHKLRAQEQVCLRAADLIVTPSSVTRDYLLTRNVPPDRIRVIPNGVDPDLFSYRPPEANPAGSEPMRMLYFGTLAPWQGVDLAIRALALAVQTFPAELTLIGPATPRQAGAVKDLARKLGVGSLVTLLEPMSQAELVEHLHRVHALVAPLLVNDRNVVQGCCPLKVLEGMAAGTPVIASDLPVVRELGQSEEHFLLVKPDSVQGIYEALARLCLEPHLGPRLAEAARRQIEARYTWDRAGAALVEAYEALGIRPLLSSTFSPPL